MLRVLLTNDDGIEADGLQALRRALLALATSSSPSSRPTATARRRRARSPPAARCGSARSTSSDGTHGYATDGTPVDCVRLAALGLIEGFEPELIVAGINHGANLGDDITYSGTVAAALEGVVLGLPAIAVSQQSQPARWTSGSATCFDFDAAAAFAARVVEELDDVPLPAGHAAEHQRARPARRAASRSRGSASGSTATSCMLVEEEDGRRRYRIYGDSPATTTSRAPTSPRSRPGRIAVTPLHFDLTPRTGSTRCAPTTSRACSRPAAEEVEE